MWSVVSGGTRFELCQLELSMWSFSEIIEKTSMIFMQKVKYFEIFGGETKYGLILVAINF